MFKKLLLKWVIEINKSFKDAGSMGILVDSLDSFSHEFYGHVKTIMELVMMPIAWTVLSLFFVLELQKISLKVEGSGGGPNMGAELVFRALVKLVMYKEIVGHTLLIMEGIYEVGVNAIRNISAGMPPIGIGIAVNEIDIERAINLMDLGDQIGFLLELMIVRFGITVILWFVKIICIGRFIELYVHIAISPIPIATLPSEELNGIAKNFFKSFAAVTFQGVVLYIVITMFPVLVNAGVLNTTTIDATALFMYSLMLALAVFSAGRWAKSFVSAM